VTNAHRFAVKVYAATGDALGPHDFIAVFHEWIQKKRLDEVLIDVTDYSHVHRGPGVVLICHDANYSVDRLDGRLGLTFHRKREREGSLADRLRASLRSTLAACRALEEAPALGEQMRFAGGELLFRVNDRLHAPNTDESFRALEPDLRAVCEALYGDAPLEIARTGEPHELFTVRVRAGGPPPAMATLLERLGA
jgi:hypothetical protein